MNCLNIEVGAIGFCELSRIGDILRKHRVNMRIRKRILRNIRRAGAICFEAREVFERWVAVERAWKQDKVGW